MIVWCVDLFKWFLIFTPYRGKTQFLCASKLTEGVCCFRAARRCPGVSAPRWRVDGWFPLTTLNRVASPNTAVWPSMAWTPPQLWVLQRRDFIARRDNAPPQPLFVRGEDGCWQKEPSSSCFNADPFHDGVQISQNARLCWSEAYVDH